MQISRKKKPNLFIRPILLVLLLGLVLVIVLEKTKVTDFIKDPTHPASQQDLTGEQQKQERDAAAQQKEQYVDGAIKQQSQAVPAEIPNDSNSIVLSPVQLGDKVIVNHQLRGQGYSSGTCKLSVANGAKSYAANADILYQPEYSMCTGFTVPTAALGTGEWTISLEVTPLNGKPLTKSSTIQVK